MGPLPSFPFFLLLSFHQQFINSFNCWLYYVNLGLHYCSDYEFHSLAHPAQNGILRLLYSKLPLHAYVLQYGSGLRVLDMFLVDLKCRPRNLELPYSHICWCICVHGTCHLLKSDRPFGIWRAQASTVLPQAIF